MPPKRTASRFVSTLREDGKKDPRSVVLGAAGAAVALRPPGEIQSTIGTILLNGGITRPPGRWGIYRSPVILHTEGTTFYSWQWWIYAREVSPGQWFVTPHAVGSWTGTNPPFSGIAINIQISAVPNAGMVLQLLQGIGYVDQVSSFANPFGGFIRSGIYAMPDTAEFTVYLMEFHPALTAIDVDPLAPVPLLSFVN